MSNWVWVYVVIALGGLAMVICFGVSLWRKSRALLTEVGVLLERADELAGLIDRLEVATNFDGSQVPHRFEDDDVEGSYVRDVAVSPGRAT